MNHHHADEVTAVIMASERKILSDTVNTYARELGTVGVLAFAFRHGSLDHRLFFIVLQHSWREVLPLYLRWSDTENQHSLHFAIFGSAQRMTVSRSVAKSLRNAFKDCGNIVLQSMNKRGSEDQEESAVKSLSRQSSELKSDDLGAAVNFLNMPEYILTAHELTRLDVLLAQKLRTARNNSMQPVITAGRENSVYIALTVALLCFNKPLTSSCCVVII